jgi:hypothetical protein
VHAPESIEKGGARLRSSLNVHERAIARGRGHRRRSAHRSARADFESSSANRGGIIAGLAFTSSGNCDDLASRTHRNGGPVRTGRRFRARRDRILAHLHAISRYCCQPWVTLP